MKDWQKDENPSQYILRNFSHSEWQEIVLTELFPPNKHFNPFPDGRLPEEVKRKISKSLLGHSVSSETRRKLSLAGRGRKQSKETCERRRQSMLGKFHTEESKEKMRMCAIGRKHAQETKDKISKLGKGAIRNAEFKEKLRNAVKGRVHITNGIINKFVFPSDIPVGFWKGRTI